MHHDYRLLVFEVHLGLQIRLTLVILLHSLEEKGGIHAECEHFLQMRHVVVREGELADGEGLDLVKRVLVAVFGAQIVNFDHTTMVLL